MKDITVYSALSETCGECEGCCSGEGCTFQVFRMSLFPDLPTMPTPGWGKRVSKKDKSRHRVAYRTLLPTGHFRGSCLGRCPRSGIGARVGAGNLIMSGSEQAALEWLLKEVL